MTTPTASAAPHNREAEEATIGAVLINPDVYYELVPFLDRDDFYIERHKYIWEAFGHLAAAKTPLDLLTVTEQLDRAGILNEVGGPAYLTALVNQVPSSLNAESYGRIVEGHAIRRRMISTAQTIVQLAYDETIPLDKSIPDAEKAAMNIGARKTDRLTSISEQIDLQKKDIETNTIPIEYSTGLPPLDEPLGGGTTPDRLYLIAGRPGHGKTSCLIGMSYDAAYIQAIRRRVLFASMEMPAKELTDRLISWHTGINTQRIEKRQMANEEWNGYTDAMDALRSEELIIDDTPNMTPEHLRLTALRTQPELIMIDYIQLMDSGLDPRINKAEHISRISRGLKLLARELHVPVIAACQLNRDVEKRKGREPQLSDLRESGALEQDSDVVIFLWQGLTDKPTEILPLHCKIAKQRGGPTGRVDGLLYRPECSRIELADNQMINPEFDSAAPDAVQQRLVQ